MTYAGAYGRNERVPIDRMLRREGHPLGVRRAEATKAATAEEREESALARKRWTLGVATGALLVAGTFAAGALGLHGGAANDTAGSIPDYTPASPGHTPGSGPVAGAPAPGQTDQQQQPPKDQPKQQPTTPTTPASAGGPQAGTPVTGGSGSGTDQSGGTQRSGGTSTPAPTTPSTPPASQPAPEQPAPPTQEEPQQQGPVGGLLGTVGDVLSPVTGAVGGILSPNSAQTDNVATTSTKTAPSGPALAMIDPLGGLLG